MMKRRFSIFNLGFFIYHGILLFALLAVLVFSHIDITTDFMALLPSNGIPEGVAEAEKQFAAKQNSNVNILFGHEDFNVAMQASLDFQQHFQNTDVFAELSNESLQFDMSSLSGLLSEYRYVMIPESVQQDILSDPEAFQSESLSYIFSPLTFSFLANIVEDPFLMDNYILTDLLDKVGASSPVMPKDGVLATQKNGKWYVLLQGVLSEKSIDISNTKGGIDDIYCYGDGMEASIDGLQISYSGFPFHSHESASNAQREISLITTVSILLILLIFVIMLRNIHVVGFFLISTFFSLFAAFSALIVLFPKVHILTMIFGTSLIGTSIDYAIHYYLAYAKRESGMIGSDVAKGLKKNLAVSFLSTVLCYALISFSQYDILRQVATFSIAGLVSSFLTVMGFYPLIVKPSMVSKNALAWRLGKMKPHRSYLGHLTVVACVLLILFSGRFRIENRITDLYEMSDRLLESEKTAGEVLGMMTSSYAIIEGSSEAESWNIDAQFSAALEELKKEGALDSYLSVSRFLPSPEQQKRSKDCTMALLPYVDSQCEILGIDSELAKEKILEPVETIELDEIPSSFSGMIGQLIPGRVGDSYYFAVIIQGADPDVISELADSIDGVTYFQKTTDIDKQLDDLTMTILLIFISAFFLIVVLLLIAFRKKGLKLALALFIIISFVLVSSPFVGLPFDFFFAVGVLLVVGLGLDYMVFAGNSKEKPMLAITLSYITTALSFGSLMLSSFKPVHIFGLTVFVGITVAYITALAAENKVNL